MAKAQVELADLTAYLREFSILLGAGVQLGRILTLLGESTNDPTLKAANEQLHSRVMAGSTLSEAMSQLPDVFDRFLICLVRAGEVGGVLDLTVAEAAEFCRGRVERQRNLRLQIALARAAGEDAQGRVEHTLEGLADSTALQYFCYMLGTMLSAEVPILQALDTAAEVLDGDRRQAVVKAREEVANRRTMTPALAEGGFPSVVVTLVEIGENEGSLDRTMIRAGDIVGAWVEGAAHRALEA